MSDILTEAVFSMQCSFIAKNAAAWAGDILTLPENYSREADVRTVARFTDEMRTRLDRLDEWAGRAATDDGPERFEAIANSVASMVIEWVDGGVRGSLDWRPGLANVIQARLYRLGTNPCGYDDQRDWQPIETYHSADKFVKVNHILCGHSEKKWMRFGRYYPEMKRWYYSGTNERSQWAQIEGDEPTHWMPLPEAPQ